MAEYYLTDQDMQAIHKIGVAFLEDFKEAHAELLGLTPSNVPPLPLLGIALGLQMASSELLMNQLNQPLLHYLMSATCAAAEVATLSKHDEEAHRALHMVVEKFPDGDFPIHVVKIMDPGESILDMLAEVQKDIQAIQKSGEHCEEKPEDQN